MAEHSSLSFTSTSFVKNESQKSKSMQRIRNQKDRIPQVYEEQNSMQDSPTLKKQLIKTQKDMNMKKQSQTEIKKYEAALRKGIEQIDRLTNLLRLRQTQVTAISSQFRDLNSSYTSLLETHSKLEQQNSVLKKNNEERQKMLLQLQSKNISSLTSEFKKEQQYIQQLQQRNRKLEMELEEEKKKNRENNRRISKLSSKVKEIQQFKSHQFKNMSNAYSPSTKNSFANPQNHYEFHHKPIYPQKVVNSHQINSNDDLKSQLQLQSNLSPSSGQKNYNCNLMEVKMNSGNNVYKSLEDKRNNSGKKQGIRITGIGNFGGNFNEK